LHYPASHTMEQARTPLTGHSAGHWLGVGGDSRWRRRVSIGWGLARGPAQGVSPSGQCGWPAASGHFVSSWRPSGAGWLRWKSRRDVQLARATTGSRLRATGWTRFRFLSLSLTTATAAADEAPPPTPYCVCCAQPLPAPGECVYMQHTLRGGHRLLSLSAAFSPFASPTAWANSYICVLSAHQFQANLLVLSQNPLSSNENNAIMS
jgi:hypothetical protein